MEMEEPGERERLGVVSSDFMEWILFVNSAKLEEKMERLKSSRTFSVLYVISILSAGVNQCSQSTMIKQDFIISIESSRGKTWKGGCLLNLNNNIGCSRSSWMATRCRFNIIINSTPSHFIRVGCIFIANSE